MTKNQLTDTTTVQINNSVSSSCNVSFASVLMGAILEVKYVNDSFCFFHYFHNAELHQLELNNVQ